MACLSPDLLQDFADGALSAHRVAEVDAHLRACPGCRDGCRALQRVEGYLRHGQDRTVDTNFAAAILDRALAGEFAAPRTETWGTVGAQAAAADTDDMGPASPRFTARRGLVASFATLAAAACVVALLTMVAPDGGGSSPSTHARVPAHAGLVDALREVYPDLSTDVDDISGRLARTGYGGVSGRGAILQALRSAWHRVRAAEDRTRLIRLAAEVSAPGFRAHGERLATEASGDALEPALLALASFGGDEAARALYRVARRRDVAPELLAEAIVRTGTGRGAPRVWDLLMAASMDRPRAYETLHRMPGRSASRVLVSAYLAGDDAAALRRVIAEREEALALLREALTDSDSEARMRSLRMLGEAGDDKAVPLLERLMRSDASRGPAMAALHKVAQSGSTDAMVALARALPQVEDANDWADCPESLTLGPVLRTLPKEAGATFLSARQGSSRSSERRRYLIAAGLSGDATVQPALIAALERPQERRAALLALALNGRAGAIEAVCPFTRSRDRGTRRCALAAAAALGGDEGARILSTALRRTADRRTVMECVRSTNERWVIPVFVDGLDYRDTRDDCLNGLRRLFDGRGPRSGNPVAWKAWLGLESERP